MPGLPPVYRSIIIDQQAQLSKLVKAAGIGPTRELYVRMLDEVTRRLDVTPSQTFTAQQMRGLLAQIKLGLARVQGAIGGAVESAADEVGIHSARTILTNAAQLERHFTGAIIPLPLLETARLRGLVSDQTSSLMRVHETSMARFGAQLVGRMEGELASSLSLGENHTQAIDRVMKLGDLEWYRAERIVRTEMSFAANRSARAAADEQAEELDGDLWSRWTEHVSDEGMPYDDRVGIDSEAMHGQVAPPDGMFTQPPSSPGGEDVGDSLVGRQWPCPPNRPNDRAVLVPWRAHWGVPGWQWEGRRVPVTENRAQAQNSRWMRSRGLTPELETGEAGEPEPNVIGMQPAAPEFEPEPEPGPGLEPAPVPIAEPVPAPTPARPVTNYIPTREELEALAEEQGMVSAVDARMIAERGWYERPGHGEDTSALDAARAAVSGREHPKIELGVSPRGRIVAGEIDTMHRDVLNAAVEHPRPVIVNWGKVAAEPQPDHVFKGTIRAHVSRSAAGEDTEIHGPFRTPGTPGRAGPVRGSPSPERPIMPIGTGERIREEPGHPIMRIGGEHGERIGEAAAQAAKRAESEIPIVEGRPLVPSWYTRFIYNGHPHYRNTRTGKSYREDDILGGHVNVWPSQDEPQLTRLQRAGRYLKRLFGR